MGTPLQVQVGFCEPPPKKKQKKLVGGWTSHLKNMLVKLGIAFPKNRDEHSKKYHQHHLKKYKNYNP